MIEHWREPTAPILSCCSEGRARPEQPRFLFGAAGPGRRGGTAVAARRGPGARLTVALER